MAKKENVVSLFAEPPHLPELKVDESLLQRVKHPATRRDW